MDLLTHSVLTGKFIDKKLGVILCGSLFPDLPFYLFYPVWATRKRDFIKSVKNNDWPEPPHWIKTLHYAFHSIPMITLGALLVRLFTGRWPKKAYAAWLLHIMIDIPTHSRRQWGPKFLWPFSDFSVDGVSWVDFGIQMVARIRQRISDKAELMGDEGRLRDSLYYGNGAVINILETD